ncbi:MAG: hypothetical protein ACLR7D_00915 [Lachnospira eligens]
MTRSTMREHIFKLLFRAPFIDNKDEYEREQINLYFADADMVDASHLKEEEYNYIKDKTLAIAELYLSLMRKSILYLRDGCNKPSRKDRAFYYETCCV